MKTLYRWLPGVNPFLAGHRLAGTTLGLLCVSQLLLWVWHGPQMFASLTGRPLDMCLAAWSSVGIFLAGWLGGLRAGRRRSEPFEPGPWRDGVQRLTASRGSRAGLWLCGLYVLVALLAPALAPYDPNRIGDGVASHSLPPFSRLHIVGKRDGTNVPANELELIGESVRVRRGSAWITIPRSELKGTVPEDWHTRRLHLLGTDRLGRDLLSRLLVGSQISLGIGLLSAVLAVLLGALVGGLAGWSRPAVDNLLMRLTDAAMSFPRLFLILLFLTVLPGSFAAVVLVLAVTGWMVPCRLVRAQILSLREEEFVHAARALGRRGSGIVFRHLLPNALAPLIVTATLRVGDTMLVEAGLSFLGLGVPPPHATWGNLVSGGRPALVEAWWIATFPGLAIVGAVLAFNLVGEGLRHAFDSRLRHQ